MNMNQGFSGNTRAANSEKGYKLPSLGGDYDTLNNPCSQEVLIVLAVITPHIFNRVLSIFNTLYQLWPEKDCLHVSLVKSSGQTICFTDFAIG